MPAALALPAPAKLNLELQVLGGRADGYHEVETTLHAVELHDLLQVVPASRTSLEVHGLSAPDDAQNLLIRGARALEEAAGRPLPAGFRLTKRIPAGAGLGGASSDAATALLALARLYGLDIELGPIAAGLGADVPFFLSGGKARAAGRGDRLTHLEPESAWFVIAWPGYELATAAVYTAWDRVGGTGSNHLCAAALEVEPRLVPFQADLGPGWQMTGSGSAFFRRFQSREQAAEAASGLDSWTAVTRTVAGR